jgi:hypothetical protein
VKNSFEKISDQSFITLIENRRILCYTAGLTGEREAGKLVFNIQHQRLGRVYAIDHIGINWIFFVKY